MNLLSQEANEDFWELSPDENFISAGEAIIRGEGYLPKQSLPSTYMLHKSEKRENPPSYVKSGI